MITNTVLETLGLVAGTLDYGSSKQQSNLIAEEFIEYKFDDDDDDDILYLCEDLTPR